MRIIKTRIGNKDRECGLAGGQERVEGKRPTVNNGAGGPEWVLGRRPRSDYWVGGPQ